MSAARIRYWIACLGLVALATVSGIASGQSRPALDTSNGAKKPETASRPVEEVVVTALRREQTVATTPIAISVLTNDSLKNNGITTPQNLPDVLPNVQNGVAGFSIRGVASGDTTEKGDPSTAFSVDGIYIARPQEQTLSFFDIERTEVLRGPQGTLYGRNATAGAINVITGKPRNYFEVSASAELANYSTRRLEAMLNTPLTDKLALRISGATNHHDGYTDTRDGSDRLDSRDDVAGRVRLLWDIARSTQVTVSGDVSRIHDSGPAYLPLDRALETSDSSLRYQNPGRDDFNRLEAHGLGVEASSDLEIAKLTYLFGYRQADTEFFQVFGDNGPSVDMQNDHRQDSHELRLASSGTSPLQWVAGLFYFHEKTNTAPIVSILNGPILLFDLHAHGRSAAGFAQATWSLGSKVRTTAGARYTDDEKARDGTFTIAGGPTFPYDADVHFKKWNWKLGLEADLPNDALFYISAATGYKAGGFNDGNPQTESNLYYDPEDLTSYEAGIKGYFGDRLYASAAVFYYDYQNLQLSSVPPTGGIVTLNAAKATIKGAEIEGRFDVIDNGAADFSIAVLDGAYDRYLPSGSGGPDYAGKSLDRSPKTSFRIGYTHTFPIGQAGSIRANVATKYSSEYFVTDFNIPSQYRQSAYWRSDASFGYFRSDDQWYLQAFVRNIENENTLGVVNFSSMTQNEPRLYGIRGGVHY